VSLPRSHPVRWITLASVVAAVVVGVIVVWAGILPLPLLGSGTRGTSAGRGLPAPSLVVIPNGTNFAVGGQNWTSVEYEGAAEPEYLLGMFSVRYVACATCIGSLGVVLVLNSSGYASFSSGAWSTSTVQPVGPAGSAVYTPNGTIFSQVTSGDFYVVFWNNAPPVSNPPQDWTLEFTVTMAFAVYPDASNSTPIPSSGLPPLELYPPQVVVLGGSTYGGTGAEYHETFVLPPTFWSWNVTGSFQTNQGADLLEVDASFFGSDTTLRSSGGNASFAWLLPPGTYLFTFVDLGWNANDCIEGCPNLPVPTSAFLAQAR